MIAEQDLRQLQTAVWEYYGAHGRHELPWRQPRADATFDPYTIMVSEIMLQQTQVSRVIPKFEAFLELFPDFASLAAAATGDVLRAWSGLGYNRRAKFLQAAAQKVEADRAATDVKMLSDPTYLVSLPGIGPNTAGAIAAYAFNRPAIFIETNIRTVFIHNLFSDMDKVPDAIIAEALTASIDQQQPREWYWALMDYGSYLKKSVGNVGRASSNYSKQSKFQGSRRQIRGQVIRSLAAEPQTFQQLQDIINDNRLQAVLEDLVKEGLIARHDTTYTV